MTLGSLRHQLSDIETQLAAAGVSQTNIQTIIGTIITDLFAGKSVSQIVADVIALFSNKQM